MAKINVEAPILSPEGELQRYKNTPNGVVLTSRDMFDDDDSFAKWGRPMTLRKALIEAATSKLDSDRGMTGESMLELHSLALKVRENVFVELSAKDITTLKTRLASLWPISVTAQAFELIEPSAAAPHHAVDAE